MALAFRNYPRRIFPAGDLSGCKASPVFGIQRNQAVRLWRRRMKHFAPVFTPRSCRGDSSCSANRIAFQFTSCFPVSGNHSTSWNAAIRGAFPGCELVEKIPPQNICSQLDNLPFAVALTGNPFVGNAEGDSQRVARAEGGRLDRILNALRGRAFAYLVIARPVNVSQVDQSLNDFASEERETRSAFMRKGSVEDGNNPRAQHYLELLRVARENHLAGRNIGMWDVGVVFTHDERQ